MGKVIVLCAALARLGGCAPDEPATTSVPDDRYPESVRRYTDPETGCQYLVSTSGSMVVRVGFDGRPMCAN